VEDVLFLIKKLEKNRGDGGEGVCGWKRRKPPLLV